MKSMLGFLTVSTVLLRYGYALQCHACADRNFFANMIDPILRGLGAPNIIARAGDCNNTASLCVAQTYCTKRTDYYYSDTAGMPGEARFWSKQCDMPPGIAAAVSPGYCVDYDKQYSNGYYVVRRMCACNNGDFCNGSSSWSSHGFLVALITASIIILQ